MSAPGLLVAGYGTMTGAMVAGWLAAGRDPASITLYNPRPKPAPQGVRLVTEVPDAPPDVLVLGFKPAMLGDVAPGLQRVSGPETLVVSVLAGVTLAQLRAAFPEARAVVRFMPNLAAALGKSVTALASESMSAEDKAAITDLATDLGHAEWLAGEGEFEAVTALAGCGPAYVYRFIDALAAGAAALGLPRDQAQRMALAMSEGAVALAAASPHPPGELARQVASPGGMTQRGLDVLDADEALARLVAATLRAARDRGLEMGADRLSKG